MEAKVKFYYVGFWSESGEFFQFCDEQENSFFVVVRDECCDPVEFVLGNLDWEYEDQVKCAREVDWIYLVEREAVPFDFPAQCKMLIETSGLSQSMACSFLGIPLRSMEDWLAGLRTPPVYVQRLILRELASML